MKTKLLLLATFLFVGFGMQASTFETDNSSTNNYYNDDYGNSFTFVERDVTFAIFQNGEFDFYINQRNALGVNYQGNGINISYNSGYDYDPYVQYDDYGAIIQIEDIPIYYDYYGRVNRIGNTNINYNSGRLVRVGGLHVYYNRQGYYSHYSGYINNYNRNYVFHPYHNYFARPLFDFRIVSHDPYRNHYQPTRYTYYSDHSRNKYYKNNGKHYKNNDKHYRNDGKRDGNNYNRQRVAAKNVPNRYDDRRDNNERTNQNSRNKSQVYNDARRTNTKERNVQDSRSNTQRSNTVNRPSSNDRVNQNSRSNTSNQRSNTVTRSNGNKAQSNTKSTRMAENRSPQRTSQKAERVQQGNKTVRETKSNGKSEKKENSKGNSSRRRN